ncbi:Mu-like prophage protein gp29 [Desulfonauticus submarinus]|uniref:Mu-like prophage protein gp29 n=1 Tax=Desulfonauticus submarinus TaxID=206665 RepID=A0A1H0GAB5_9BACT|nr:DUF935 family protein [Desulfonauticus submarinus]SDO03778.1 Mu-like prophage protein gp29 [Desulfonauticus submarinus]
MKKGIYLPNGEFIAFQDDSLTDVLFTRSRSMDFQTVMGLLPNPDPVLKKKSIDISVYKDLLIDSRVGGCVRSRKAGILKLEWFLDGGTSRARKEISAYFKDLDIYRIMSEMLDGVLFGYKPLEIIWDRGKFILPKDIIGLPQRWFGFDEDGKIRFLSKDAPMQGEEVPEKKLLLVTSEASYENPYGKPLLSEVFWPVTFKRGGYKFWITFLEKYGLPYLIGKVPVGTSDDKKNELLSSLSKMVMDAVAVIEENSSIDILSTQGKGNSSLFSEFLKELNAEISISILGQNLTTEVREGSRAAAQVHQTVREDLIIADKMLIKKAFNTLIKWICELNFNSEPPEFKFIEEDDPQTEWAERDDILSKQITFTKKYYQKRYHLEDDDFEVKQEIGFKEHTFSEQKFTPEQQVIEDLIGRALEDLDLSDHKDFIVNAVKKANSFSEIEMTLAEIVKDVPTEKFEELLKRCLIASDLWGRYSVKKNWNLQK